MNLNSKIFVAGHHGLVGSAIVKNLTAKGYTNLVFRTHQQLDLLDQLAVNDFFETEKPDYVILAAAKVGGIVANNTYRGEFIYENLTIQNNVIHAAYLSGVTKLLFLGSTCIYPRDAPQPMPEDSLLTGPLEYTNEPYAIAKIAGIKMCESYNLQYGTNYISVMPTNLYGPNDNFDLEKSHVLPGLLRKIHLGKCLEEGDWDAIRADLGKRPVEGEGGCFASLAMTEGMGEEGCFASLTMTEGMGEGENGRMGEEARIEIGEDAKIGNGENENKIIEILTKYGITLSSSHPLTLSPSHPHPSQSVSVEIWGSGTPMREFLWSEEMADACVYLMENIDFGDLVSRSHLLTLSSSSNLPNSSLLREIRNSHINIGTGKEISIRDLAFLIKKIIGFKGELVFNTSKPDGTMRKLTDVSKLNQLGWQHQIEIEEGVGRLYEWYLDN